MSEMSGGEVIARMLKAEGIRHLFGIVDGTYLGLCVGLREEEIALISPRHETSAAHMAGAYARLTGGLGVCMASNGPGAANLLPGIAVEQGEGNRVLAITSSRRTGITGPERGGTYQYFDQTGVIGKMAKWSERVPSFERLAERLRAALRASWEGRPGVVHLDVPEDVMNGRVKADLTFWEPARYRRTAALPPPDDQLDQATDWLLTADRPVLHAGSGVIHAGAFEELRAVAELLRAPVTTSWGGRAAIAETSEVAFPMIHVELVNEIRSQADLVLALGSRLGETDWWGKAPYWGSSRKQRLIQVDQDGQVLGANKPADLPVLAEVRVFLRRLHERLLARQGEIPSAKRNKSLEGYRAERAKARRKLDAALGDRSGPMNSGHVAAECRQFFGDDAILVADGGNAAVWANFYHEVRKPNTLLSTFKFGMLGAGCAQALGAAVARPQAPVYCITGDGAMGFHSQEVETAVRNRLTPIYLVLCDRQWGMVKMNQQFALKPLKTLLLKSLKADETINTDLGEIRFDLLAQSMGAHGERVSEPDQLRPALERSRASGKCAVIHVDVNPVSHMWAPGLLHFKDMHQEPKGE
ncbi:MAG TPA: thiamine pyrophosphate-binding protein [Vicinamibacteria bacterium]|nr:thiamine pyrophosphate-binding protein [Vicinamibacteria bacterium]